MKKWAVGAAGRTAYRTASMFGKGAVTFAARKVLGEYNSHQPGTSRLYHKKQIMPRHGHRDYPNRTPRPYRHARSPATPTRSGNVLRIGSTSAHPTRMDIVPGRRSIGTQTSSANNMKRGGNGPSPVSYANSSKRSGKRLPANVGVMRSMESIGKVQDAQCAYIGHSTVALNNIIQGVARSVVKAFWKKEGITVESNDTTGPALANQFSITYYSTPTSITTSFLASATILSGANFTTAQQQVAILIYNIALAADRKYEFTQMQWISIAAGFKHSAHMNSIRITGTMTSTLTFQNTTANATGTDTTDVNNANPVSVHQYSGVGNGTSFMVRQDSAVAGTFKSFIADYFYGVISVAAAEVTDNFLNEPPPSKLFAHATKGKTIILQPGAIHKSYIRSGMDMTLSAYINMHYGLDMGQQWRVPRGNFTFFACEKVVTSTAATPPKIELDYEVDQKLHFVCTMKRHDMVVPQNLTQVSLPVVG